MLETSRLPEPVPALALADHLQAPRQHGLFNHHGIDLGDGTVAHYLEGRAILLVGAGKMGALSAKALKVLGANAVLVTNRSAERGQALAEQVGGTFRPWEQLEELLVEAESLAAAAMRAG